jgi:hypothetical protein
LTRGGCCINPGFPGRNPPDAEFVIVDDFFAIDEKDQIPDAGEHTVPNSIGSFAVKAVIPVRHFSNLSFLLSMYYIVNPSTMQ